MPLSGTFSTMPFPDLLQWLSDSRRTGALSVTLEFEERLLHMDAGNVWSVESDDPRALDLGEVLVRRGLLEPAEVERASEHARRTGQTLGEVAVVLKPGMRERLQEAIRDHAVESVLGLFLWRDGRFYFSEGETSTSLQLAGGRRPPRLSRPIDSREILMEGMRRLDEWQRIAQVFPSDYCQVHALGPGEGLPIVAALHARGEPAVIGELWAHRKGDRFRIYEELFRGYQAGLIAVDEQVLSPLAPASETSPVDALVQNAQVLLDERQFDEAAALLRSALEIDPFRAEARDLMRRARDEQLADLYQTIPPFKVPVLTVARERLAKLNLSPRELHVASRVNGRWDVGALVVVTPVGELETMRALKRLIHVGAVRFVE